MKAIKDNFDVLQSVVPLLRTTTVTGSAVDLANAQENMILVQCGALTDGTHTPKITECATSGGTYTDVAAADLVGSLSALTANTAQLVSYIGSLRYIKVVITTTGSPATGACAFGDVVVKYRKQP
jgi:hypothetical protein